MYNYIYIYIYMYMDMCVAIKVINIDIWIICIDPDLHLSTCLWIYHGIIDIFRSS